MRDRRAKQRHDAIAHHLVDGALVAVHGLHHAFEHRVEELAGLLGVAVGQQLHRALQVGKEHGHLLALAFEGSLGGEDLLGQMARGVAGGGLGLRAGGCSVSGVAHCPQKANPGGLSKPHCGQRRPSGLAHCPQNFMPSGFSKPQLGQRMGVPSGTAVRAAGCARAGAPARATDMGVWDGVSVLQGGQVSSEKHETAADAGVEEEG